MSLRFSLDCLDAPSTTLIHTLARDVAPGTVLSITGRSGCGKSSLLAWLAGHLQAPMRAKGEIWLSEQRIDQLVPERRNIGLVFQDHLLFPHLSVGENLAFGLRGDHRPERLEAALVAAELEGFAERDPQSLSGGQKARVAVLRTLLAEPRALLLDEPFSRLDLALRQRFRQWVWAQVERSGLPTVLVTHDHTDIPEHLPGQVLEMT